MNMNKKFDRLKQWTNERMGQEVKTNVSDDFRALELEMELREKGSLYHISGMLPTNLSQDSIECRSR